MNIEAFKLAIQRFAKNDLSAFTTKDKREVLGVLAGYLLAMKSDLPTSPVTELVNYYVVTHEPVNIRVLSQVNEVEFIDTTLAREVARNVYLLRYNLVYNPETLMKLSPTILTTGAAALPSKVQEVFDKIGIDNLAKINTYYF